MAKMFVHYSKTKAEFISAGLATTYNNSIVFIKGDAQGNGSCIYTHGQYFANFAEFLAAVNFVKGIKIGEQSYNAAAGGGYVAFSASDPSTIAVNAGQNGVEIGLTTAFVNKVNETATELGTKNDAASSTGSAFARIANLAALVSDLTGGSTDSIEGQITNAINNLRDEILGEVGDDDVLDIHGLNVDIWNLTDRVYAIEQDYLKAADKKELDDKIKANTDAIGVLNGNASQTGSVDKKIADAINAFATNVTNNDTIDTLKELVDYVAGVDGSDKLATALAQIDTNKGAIETLNGGSTVTGSVDKKVADAISAEVSRADGKYYVKPSTGIAKTDLASAVQTSLGKADTAIQSISVMAGDYMTQTESTDNNEYRHSIGVTVADVDMVTAKGQALADAYDVKTYVDNAFAWEEL